MILIDDFTRRHLSSWLDHQAGDDEDYREELRAQIKRALTEEPDLVEHGFSWPEIARRGSCGK